MSQGMVSNSPTGYTLAEALESVGQGWAGLIRDVFARKPADVVISQVKEKLGGLRIYDDGASDDFHQFLHTTEELSFTICEACGLPGTLTREGGYWYRTRCAEHAVLHVP